MTTKYIPRICIASNAICVAASAVYSITPAQSCKIIIIILIYLGSNLYYQDIKPLVKLKIISYLSYKIIKTKNKLIILNVSTAIFSR